MEVRQEVRDDHEIQSQLLMELFANRLMYENTIVGSTVDSVVWNYPNKGGGKDGMGKKLGIETSNFECNRNFYTSDQNKKQREDDRMTCGSKWVWQIKIRVLRRLRPHSTVTHQFQPLNRVRLTSRVNLAMV